LGGEDFSGGKRDPCLRAEGILLGGDPNIMTLNKTKTGDFGTKVPEKIHKTQVRGDKKKKLD